MHKGEQIMDKYGGSPEIYPSTDAVALGRKRKDFPLSKAWIRR
jgi:hypothetical protein